MKWFPVLAVLGTSLLVGALVSATPAVSQVASEPGQVVVLDNASFHKSKRTVDLIEAAGCRILFQPPYSPDLNKIEPMWANIKQRLKSYYDDAISFIDNLEYHFIGLCKC